MYKLLLTTKLFLPWMEEGRSLSSLFDLILSGSYREVHQHDKELYDYLPRVTFYATYCWPSLFKSLFRYPEVNRIQSCFEIDPKSLIRSMEQSMKNQPVERLLFSATDQDSTFHHTIEQFEKGTAAEQIRIVSLELYQLSKIFHYDIPDDRVKIPEISLPTLSDDPQQKNKKKRDKLQEKQDERKRKKYEKVARQCKLTLKQEAAARLPILSSSAYSPLLHEFIPCIPFILPCQSEEDEVSLSIPNIVLSLLLSHEMGLSLIKSITRNHPSSLEAIVNVLLANIPLFPSLIQDILKDLCSISISCAKVIREQLTSQQKLPGVVLSITSEILHDEISFISCLLSQCGWIKGCLRKTTNLPIRTFLLDRLKSHHDSLVAGGLLSVSNRLEVISLLRIYCTVMNTFVDEKEAKAILNLISSIELDAEISQLGLSFMLVCEGLLNIVEREFVSKMMTKLLSSNECTEFFLLIAIHFHTKKTTAIVELVRSKLQLHTIFHTDSLTQIGTLITSQIFTEEDVARRAIELKPVHNLSTDQNTSLTLSCIYHLLKSQLFIRYKVDVGKWVFSQLSDAHLPVHHLLPAILEEFVASALNKLRYGYIHEFRMSRISEQDIRSVMNDQTKSQSPKVLLLYYLLHYNKQLIDIKTQEATKNMRPSQTSVNQILSELEYSEELLDSLPIQSILSHLHSNPKLYENIYPPLLSMIVSQFPRFFLSENLLMQEDLRSSHYLQYGQYHHPLDDQSLKKLFSADEIEITRVITVLNRVRHLEIEKAMKFIPIIMNSLIPFFLEHQLGCYKLLQEFQLVWEKVYCENPAEIGLMTVNLFRQKNEKMAHASSIHGDESSTYPMFTDANLVNDPLIILRADSRVFTCPPLVQMLLQVLDSYMIASRSHLVTQAEVSPVGSTKKDELHTLLFVQDSAILQMLLEVCISNEQDENVSTGAKEEINTLICGFLHAQFIKNPLLVKLLHFQGYDHTLIAMLVDGVPSLHLCLEFVPELMSQPKREKQLFAVRLGAELVRKFPLASSLELGRLILNHLGAMSGSADCVEFLEQALPCVKTLFSCFPALVEPTSQLLLDMKGDNTISEGKHGSKSFVSCREVRSNAAVQAVVSNVFAELTQQISL